MSQRKNNYMSCLSKPPAHHRPCRQRSSSPKQTVCITAALLLNLALAFPRAVAMNRALFTLIKAPVETPTGSAFSVPTVAVRQSRQAQAVDPTFQECIIAMNSTDDSFLNQNEYMLFVNKLSNDAFQGQALGEVMIPIRKNFWQLAGDNGQIDVSGSRPGDDPSDEEIANLQNICESTSAAINESLTSTEAPSPTASPVLSQGQCFAAMNTSNTNGDSFLNQSEYFSFVNIVSGGEFSNSSFPSLPPALRQNFFKWRDNETSVIQINIFGSRTGENASDAQLDFLIMVCEETDATIEEVLSPTTAPVDRPTVKPSTSPPTPSAPVGEPTIAPSTDVPSTPAPSAPDTSGDKPTTTPSMPVDAPTLAPSRAPSPTSNSTPTAAPTVAPSRAPSAATNSTPTAAPSAVNVTIQSEFAIYNTLNLDADAVEQSPAFDDLTQAYSNLAQGVVAENGGGRYTRFLQRTSGQRRLTVNFIFNSANIASLSNMTACPPGTPMDALCQRAVASYRVSVVNEDEDEVSEIYTSATQTAIDDGALQEDLTKINPNSIITVAEPSATPTLTPTGPPSEDELSNGAIAGIAISGAFVMLGAGAALYYSQKKHMKPGKKPISDSSVDGWGKDGEGDNDVEDVFKKPSRVSEETRPTAPLESSATEEDFNKYADDDYSYQSGSFYDDSNSAMHSPTSHAGHSTTSRLEDYKFDEPGAEKQYVAPAIAGAAATSAAPPVRYESSSNAGSSGWSSSEEDTDYEAEGNEPSSDNEGSSDSFFNEKNVAAESGDQFFEGSTKQGPNAGAIAGGVAAGAVVAGGLAAAKRTDEPGQVSTSGSESTTSGSVSSGSESTSMSASTSGSSESQVSGPSSSNNGTGTYSQSYGDSTFSGASPQSQPRAAFTQSAAAAPPSDSGPNTAAIAGGVTAGVVGAAAIGAAAYAVTREDDSSDSASYTSSDSTYDESRSSRSSVPSTHGGGATKSSGAGKSYATGDLSGSAKQRVSELEDLVKNGDWDGVIASAKKFEKETDSPESISTSSKKASGASSRSFSSSGSSSEGSRYSEEPASESSRSQAEFETSGEQGLDASGETGRSWTSASDNTGQDGSTVESETPEEAERRAEYRAEVEALVRVVVPEEINNVDVMMQQFRGREAELVSTLRNMQERSVAQRARAAVHKSSNQPPRRDPSPGQYRRDGNYSTDSRMSQNTEETHGSAAGSAAIAAASVPRPAARGRVPIQPPPLPAHESTEIESLGTSDSNTQGRSISTDGSDRVSGSQFTSSGSVDHTSTSGSKSNDSQSGSSGSSRSSSGHSSSRSDSSGSSSGSSSSDSREEDLRTSQGAFQGAPFTGDPNGNSKGNRKTVSKLNEPQQRRGSINANQQKLKPWLRGGEHEDDDASEDYETMGVSVGQFSRRR